MNNVKFRVWDEGKNKMIYPDFPFSVFTGNLVLKLDPTMKENRYFIVDGDFIFMQFTGLTDYNNIDVYEGDMLVYRPANDFEGEEERITGYVGFDNGTFVCFGLDGEIKRQMKDGSNEWYSIENIFDFEVTGNIYESGGEHLRKKEWKINK